MRQSIIVAILALISATVCGQNLQEIYKRGPVKLAPSPTYASDNNWEELFSDYHSELYGKELGKLKSLAVAADGSVFISNRSSWNIYKFDRSGRFVKAFGEEGTGEGQFRLRPVVRGVLDNEHVVVTEHNGRINLFDTDGNWVRMVYVDYMPLACVPLREGKIAVWAHVGYKGGVRYIVAIVDVDTGEEQIVSSYRKGQEELGSVTFKQGSCMISMSNPYSKLEAGIDRTPDGNLVVGWNDSRTIEVFSPLGDLLTSFNLQSTPPRIGEEVKREFVQGAESMIDSMNDVTGKEEALAQLRSKEFFPEHMPHFYSLIVDSEDNLLVYVYTEEEPAMEFHVYSLRQEGGQVATSELTCEEFSLGLHSKYRELAFYDGKLYGILPQVNGPDIPLRLVEFELGN